MATKILPAMKYNPAFNAYFFETSRQVDYVKEFKASKDSDTLFVAQKIIQDIKISKDSKLYFDENLCGPSNITVKF